MLHIIAQGQAYFKSMHIPQWQNGYPDTAQIEADIQNGHAYVAGQNGTITGTAALVPGPEAAYSTLHGGSWLRRGEGYAVIHRMAVANAAKGTGTAAALLQRLEEAAHAASAATVRLDTHRSNRAMQRFLHKHGYTQRGVVYLAPRHPGDDTARVALEKLLAPGI